VPGAEPAAGVTVSQLPPLLVEGVTVNGVLTPAEVAIVRSWLCGTVLLAAKLKESEEGVVESGEVPEVLTFRMTGTMLVGPTR